MIYNKSARPPFRAIRLSKNLLITQATGHAFQQVPPATLTQFNTIQIS